MTERDLPAFHLTELLIIGVWDLSALETEQRGVKIMLYAVDSDDEIPPVQIRIYRAAYSAHYNC